MSRAAGDLRGQVTDYLTLRRSLGHQLQAPERMLTDFTDWLAGQPQPQITTATVLAWASGQGSAAGARLSERRIAARVSVARGFASYLRAFDPTVEVPARGLVRVALQRRPPYLFSAAEIDALMSASVTLPGTFWPATMRTLIGLMAATGLRTSEVPTLDRTDHDPHAGTLLVRFSKYGRSRLLPLHLTVNTALVHYAHLRDECHPHPTTPALLLTEHGERIGQHPPLGETFRRLLTQAGISAPAGPRTPRLSDLRHGFAISMLRDWHLDGAPVQPRLPALSYYLGHRNPSSTYWYLQAVPELMSPVLDRFENYLADTSTTTIDRVES